MTSIHTTPLKNHSQELENSHSNSRIHQKIVASLNIPCDLKSIREKISTLSEKGKKLKVSLDTSVLMTEINFFARTMSGKNENSKVYHEQRIKIHNAPTLSKKALETAKMIGKIIPKIFKIIAFFLTDIVTYPINQYRIRKKIENQIKNDINTLDRSTRVTKQGDVEASIKEHCLNINKKCRMPYIKAALSTYVSSKEHYGPVVLAWAKSLLDTAKIENRKLIFMARDGIAPYEVAKILKRKHPELYGNVDLSLVYLSRKVVDSSLSNKEDPEILEHYLQQESHIKNKDKCLFVDIGFRGSKIDETKKLLKNMNLDINFAFLVSLTDKAHGFIGDIKTPLESLHEAGSNLAVHWLEDTHQGVINSPTKLIIAPKKNSPQQIEILPNVLEDKDNPKTCKDDPLNYLLKLWGLKGIIDAAEEANIDTSQATTHSWEIADAIMKKKFDDFLDQIYKNKRVLFIKHV